MTAVLPRVADEANAKIDLALALDALTTPRHLRVEHDDGSVTWGKVASLLDQLDEAITSPSGAAGSFAPRSKPPLYLDALSLLAEIDTMVGEYDRQTRAGQVRAWAVNAGLAKASDTVPRWASMARTLLDPRSKRRRVRGAACPSCKASRVFEGRDRDAGESHYRPALEIDTERGVCRCTAPRCGYEVTSDRWDFLARVLEQQRLDAQGEQPEEVGAS